MSPADSPQGETLHRLNQICVTVAAAHAHALDRRDHGTPAEQEAACASHKRAVVALLGVAEVLRDLLSGPHPEWPSDWGPSQN